MAGLLRPQGEFVLQTYRRIPADSGAAFGRRPGRQLLNNMAWGLRRFPVFPIFGRGDFPVQPVYAEGLAAQAVAASSRTDSFVTDAAGPETFSFEELLRLLASGMGVRCWFVHTPPSGGFALTEPVGLLLRDVVLTREEVDGLMAGLLTSNSAPTGTTKLGDSLAENMDIVGRSYVSERRRKFRCQSPRSKGSVGRSGRAALVRTSPCVLNPTRLESPKSSTTQTCSAPPPTSTATLGVH